MWVNYYWALLKAVAKLLTLSNESHHAKYFFKKRKSYLQTDFKNPESNHLVQLLSKAYDFMKFRHSVESRMIKKF